MRRLVVGAMAVGAITAVGGAAMLWQAWQVLNRPVGAAAQGYLLDVGEGRSLREIADQLAADGIVDQPLLWRAYARWQQLDQKIQAGEYVLDATISQRGILDKLVAGEVYLHSLTLVEGWTLRELLTAVAEHPAIRSTLTTGDPEQLPAALGLELAHAEGWFFPDTYRFPRGTSDAALLLQAHALMEEKLASAWAERADGLPLEDAYDALILASIVERETALDVERPRVAGVFVRRLQKGMRLQTDPTVIYVMGPSFDGNLRRKDLRTHTPDNTYPRRGLPPTPTALPGEASLRAAVNPADEEALYFVATGLPDGTHTFSATLDDHNAAVTAYLDRLRARKDGS